MIGALNHMGGKEGKEGTVALAVGKQRGWGVLIGSSALVPLRGPDSRLQTAVEE